MAATVVDPETEPISVVAEVAVTVVLAVVEKSVAPAVPPPL